MSTEYTHLLTVCTPLTMLDEANALACIVGENKADIRTFTKATHTLDGVEYACVSTVVKGAAFFGYLSSEELPMPEHAQGVADPVLAQAAKASIGTPGGLVMDLRPSPYITPNIGGPIVSAIEELGFEPIEEEDEDDEGGESNDDDNNEDEQEAE